MLVIKIWIKTLKWLRNLKRFNEIKKSRVHFPSDFIQKSIEQKTTMFLKIFSFILSFFLWFAQPFYFNFTIQLHCNENSDDMFSTVGFVHSFFRSIPKRTFPTDYDYVPAQQWELKWEGHSIILSCRNFLWIFFSDWEYVTKALRTH